VLEPAPYKLVYHYRCRDEPTCSGHQQTCIDWEAGQAARHWHADGYSADEIPQRLRRRFLDEMCGPARDTYFYVGNQHLHPKGFLVLGVFWPPAGSRTPDALF
jgi:hypothetical protein